MYAVDIPDTEATLLLTRRRIYEPNNTQSSVIGNVLEIQMSLEKRVFMKNVSDVSNSYLANANNAGFIRDKISCIITHEVFDKEDVQ